MNDQPARLLDCGLCYEEQGEEVHPHPECPIAAPADRAALRDRIAEALYAQDHPGHLVPLNETGMEPAYREPADAVLAVLPAPTDQTAALTAAERQFLRFALDLAQEQMFSRGDEFDSADEAALARLRRMADETQPAETTVPDEDPARIDRLRPEFFEHASVEAIDVQIRRAQSQQRHWGNRERTLGILRQARAMQKGHGERPAAGARQDGAQR
jgi:hypothetical protein